MKYNFSVLIVFSYIFSGCTAEVNQTSVENDIDNLKKLEHEWLVAEFKLDTSTISALMDTSYVYVGLDGLTGKAEDLKAMHDNISQRLKNGHVIDTFHLEDMRVKIYDNTAVVTFVIVTFGSTKDGPFQNRRTRFYDVWVKREGKWKMVASQGTSILSSI